MKKLKRLEWTAAHEALARQMLDDRRPRQEFIDRLGRTKNACAAHFYYLKHPYSERKDKKRRAEEEGEVAFPRPTDDMMRDAEIRNFKPRSIVSWICGDPAPGYSALDQRQAPCWPWYAS